MGRLCEDVRRGGDGDELAQDVLGHLQVVLRDHQCFLDVLVRVALTHQVLDLAADLRVGFYRRRSSDNATAARGGGDWRARAGSTLGVDPPRQRLRGSLWRLRQLHKG